MEFSNSGCGEVRVKAGKSRRRPLTLLAVMLLTAAVPVSAQSSRFVPATALCEVGAYRSPSGQAVAIAQSLQTPPRPGGMTYTFLDGRWGNTADDNPPLVCDTGAVFVKMANGTIERWPRAPLRFTRTRFQSGGHVLAGMLVQPEEQQAPPLVVLAHGSERVSAINFSMTPLLLAGQGVSAFVFDKHGTGESTGKFHMNFTRLAADVVAASVEAKRLAGGKYSRFGLYGGSQGGWVAPLAARGAGAEFMAIGFGGVFSPAEEDAFEVQNELRAKGYKDDVLAKAKRLTDATAVVRISDYREGLEQLEKLKREFAGEPWVKDAQGEYTGYMVSRAGDVLRRQAGQNSLQLNYGHDAMAVLRGTTLPILWVVAGEDLESPPQITLKRLGQLRAEGKPIQVVVFPETDHGMQEFTQKADGSRQATRTTEGYWRLLADWMKGRSNPPYGRAVFGPNAITRQSASAH